ncbi:MAG TPA: hypothetical protein VKM37_08170 [Balneolaceae bacterium]|nr:hypothetical protein [Balneolaceae bacterium]
MSAWIWVLIPLVAIIGGYVIDYQKNKLKWQNQTSSNEAELEELRAMMSKMKQRIENLEAIAAHDSESFREAGDLNSIELDLEEQEEKMKKENQQTVANKVKTKGK